MWFLPTHERPERLREVLDACVSVGMSTPGIVIVNGGPGQSLYDSLTVPPNWTVIRRPHDEPVADAYRFAFQAYPDLGWYGFLTDDLVPVTPGWDTALVEKAGSRRIVSSNDGWQAPNRIHGAFVVGGDLMRAMGGIAPEGFQHQFLDDVLETIGRDLGVWDVDMNVLVEHRHPMKTGAELDPSYKRNFSRQRADQQRFQQWDRFEKRELYKRLAAAGFAKKGAVKVVDLRGKMITFATPCYGGQINHLYVQALAQTIPLLLQHQVGYNLITVPKESTIQRARNYIVSQFLKGDGTHLMFIDADMGWNPNDVLNLLAAEKDIVAAAGPRKETPVTFCWNPINGGGQPIERCPDTGCIKARHVGTGFMMIRRNVLERMIAEYPDTKYRDVQTGDDYHALFEFTRSEGYQWSEDYTFCDRWRGIGGDVWVNPMIELQHVGEQVYSGKLFDALNKKPTAVTAPEKAA